MIKINKLVILLYFILFSVGVQAQTEMDLLLSEDDNNIVQDASDKPNSLDNDSSFSDTLTSSSEPILSEDDNHNVSETWLKSLFREGSKNFFKTEEEKEIEENKALSEKLMKQKANAAFFDIAGIKLRMSPKEIENILTQQGYQKIMETLEVPNFIKWRSEEICRTSGIIGFERLKTCATKIAQENGYQYIHRQSYSRNSTRESIEILFTSTFTDNLSYKIFYKSNVTFSQSKSSQNVYLNNIKIYDFWRRISLKYGTPDNKTEIKWGKGGKKPYLKARMGELELMDPLLISLDTTRMFQADSRLSNTQYYNF